MLLTENLTNDKTRTVVQNTADYRNTNEISIVGTQNFMGKEIPVVLGGFGVGKKCVSDKTVAEIHGMREPDARRRITDNIKRFRENIDFIDMKQSILSVDTSEKAGVHEVHTLELLQSLGYTRSAITQAKHIYILSERGYAKLIKIMDTDLAWEIHDNLMDEYFEMREEKIIISELPPDMQYMNILCQNMNKVYLEQQKQSKEMNRLKEDIKQLEAKVTTHNEDYYSVAGYASLRGINVDISKASMLGRKASKISKSYGYDIGGAKDPRFGRVNTYHVDILKEVFKNIV